MTVSFQAAGMRAPHLHVEVPNAGHHVQDTLPLPLAHLRRQTRRAPFTSLKAPSRVLHSARQSSP